MCKENQETSKVRLEREKVSVSAAVLMYLDTNSDLSKHIGVVVLASARHLAGRGLIPPT